MAGGSRKHRKKSNHAIFWIVFLEVLIVLLGLILVFLNNNDGRNQEQTLLEEPSTIAYEEETEDRTPFTPVNKPEISEQLLTINDWSRPGKKIKSLDYIVIHYLGNPGTTAQQNHDYFESLKDLQDTSMSANYVVGLEGEIIHCVPDDEVAYASNQANRYSISIENCHPDETGRFTDETYKSLVKLTAYLSDLYQIDEDHIIRHYDVTGKDCPKWFVEHPDDWEKFKDDVMTYRQECEDARNEKISELSRQTEKDVLKEYLDSIGTETEVEAETSDSDLWDALKKKAEAFQSSADQG